MVRSGTNLIGTAGYAAGTIGGRAPGRENSCHSAAVLICDEIVRDVNVLPSDIHVRETPGKVEIKSGLGASITTSVPPGLKRLSHPATVRDNSKVDWPSGRALSLIHI